MQTPLRSALFGTLFLSTLLACAQSDPGAAFDPRKLQEIPTRMQRFVDDHTMSGSVTLVARHGQIASLEAVGFADLAQKKPMQTDSLFWIASMTKPITAAAVLMLQDAGKLSVQDPVEKHLPEFKSQWMIEARSNDTLTLKRPPRPITIRDLLTHTSGLGDVPAPRYDCSLAELVMAYSQQPLQFPPGSKWSYSNSGINTLGRIVEVVSGQPFAEFLQSRLFDPLGMGQTSFWPKRDQAERLAISYQPRRDGAGLESTEINFLKGELTDRRRTVLPAGGLISTAQDYYRFCQMMLNGGHWNGKRLLSREAVEMMTHTQTGDIKTGFTEGMSFGFGFAVVKQPVGVAGMLAPGTFGHGGAFGTQAWTDPQKDLVLILMIQRAKLPNADASEVRRVFQETAVAAIHPAGAMAVGSQPAAKPKQTRLGITGTQFTLNGTPTFLYGISYYGALGAPEESIRRDLEDMKRYGFNWIRLWANWAAFDNNVAAVDEMGDPRPAHLAKLKWLIEQCDRSGLVVDVTLSRGNGITGPPRLQTLAAHSRAVETLVTALKPFQNWYLDLSNERNIQDKRFTSYSDLTALRRLVRRLDPERLVTASHAGDVTPEDLRQYLLTIPVDFLAPHRPRHAESPRQTEAKSRDYLAASRALGGIVPLHYQEPFRRGFDKWEPSATDFVADLRGALAGGAAGWCLHNGDHRDRSDGHPRRSFDLRDKRLFDQLDAEERSAIELMRAIVGRDQTSTQK